MTESTAGWGWVSANFKLYCLLVLFFSLLLKCKVTLERRPFYKIFFEYKKGKEINFSVAGEPAVKRKRSEEMEESVEVRVVLIVDQILSASWFSLSPS